MHTTTWLRNAALVLACAAAGAARAELIEIDWDADGAFQRSASVAPGAVTEVCGRLARGVSVRWSFAAGQPVDFNIHHHVGKRVVFAARRDAIDRAQGRLAVTLDQTYCWMWTNRSAAAVALELQLQRAAAPGS